MAPPHDQGNNNSHYTPVLVFVPSQDHSARAYKLTESRPAFLQVMVGDVYKEGDPLLYMHPLPSLAPAKKAGLDSVS